MATITPVYLGVVANDGTGDPLRTGGSEINQNFANLNADKLEKGGYGGDANDLNTAISAIQANYVTTNTAQSVTDLKTFSIAPRSTVAPVSDIDLANKLYVDNAITAGGLGDMTKAIYDPNFVEGDAFDMDNMVDGAVNVVLTLGVQTIEGAKTFDSAMTIQAGFTATGGISNFEDNVLLTFGSGEDVEVYFDADDFVFDFVTGDSVIFKNNGTDVFSLDLSTGDAVLVGDFTATRIIKQGGTGTEVLLADGTTAPLAGGGSAPIPITYADDTALFADQGSQLQNYIYQVTDGSGFTGVTSGAIWVKYLGTTAGDETDYIIISAEEWASGATSPLTTKGDLLTNNGSTDVRLPVGGEGLFLVTDATEDAGVKWANGIEGNGNFFITDIDENFPYFEAYGYSNNFNKDYWISIFPGSINLQSVDYSGVSDREATLDLREGEWELLARLGGNSHKVKGPATPAGDTTISFPNKAGSWTSPLTINGVAADPSGNITISTSGGNVSNSGTPVANQLAIWTSATEIKGLAQLIWASDGLRIEGTGASAFPLTVSADSSAASNDVYFTVSSGSTGLAIVDIGSSASATTLVHDSDTNDFFINVDGTERLRIEDGGDLSLMDGSNEAFINMDLLTGNITAQLQDRSGILAYILGNSDTATGSSYTIDWDVDDTLEITATSNFTFSETNAPSAGESKVISIYMTGNYTITYPNGNYNVTGDAYDGTVENLIVIEYISSTRIEVRITNLG